MNIQFRHVRALRHCRIVLLAALFGMIFPQLLHADDFQIIVSDTQNKEQYPAANAVVNVYYDNRRVFEGETDKDGIVYIDLAPGKYYLELYFNGFRLEKEIEIWKFYNNQEFNLQSRKIIFEI